MKKNNKTCVDLDIEVSNLCSVYGCEDCPGCQNSSEEALIFCSHGCHPEIQAPRIKNLKPESIVARAADMK